MEELTAIAADIMEASATVASAMERIDEQERVIAELREHSEATMSVLTEVLIATDAEIEALKAENVRLRGLLASKIADKILEDEGQW